MSVIRVEKTKDYTVMSNYHLREKKMSLKAKGLLSLMLALPPNWDYSIRGLVSICKEKELAIKNTLDAQSVFSQNIDSLLIVKGEALSDTPSTIVDLDEKKVLRNGKIDGNKIIKEICHQ